LERRDARIRPADVVEAAAAKLRELVAFIEREAAAGDPAQRAVLDRGDVALYERDAAYLEQFGYERSRSAPAPPAGLPSKVVRHTRSPTDCRVTLEPVADQAGRGVTR